MIGMNNVRVRYGRKTALDLDSVTLPTGMVYVLGPNGAGKTTLFTVLVGLNNRLTGMITVGGKDLSTLHTDERAALLGYLSQRFQLLAWQTVADNVRYAAWSRGVDTAHIESHVDAALKDVDLSDKKNARVRSLSGGMKQRVGIACAVAHQHSVLVLDEPTVGLDPTQRNKFYGALQRQAEQRTVLVSTHILAELERTPGHVLVLSEGRRVFDGHSSELASAGDDTVSLQDGYDKVVTSSHG